MFVVVDVAREEEQVESEVRVISVWVPAKFDTFTTTRRNAGLQQRETLSTISNIRNCINTLLPEPFQYSHDTYQAF